MAAGDQTLLPRRELGRSGLLEASLQRLGLDADSLS
jgi:hypothetical protein